VHLTGVFIGTHFDLEGRVNMAPVPSSSSNQQKKQPQDYNYMNQMMPPPAVPMRQFPQQNAYMAYPAQFQNQQMGGYNTGYHYQQQPAPQQAAPQVESMTLNIDHPGTYAITLNYQPRQDNT